MMYGYGFGWGWIAMLIGGLVFAGLAALTIYAIARLTRGTVRTPSAHPDSAGQAASTQAASGRALEILAERYARGEINDEEYARMKGELRK